MPCSVVQELITSRYILVVFNLVFAYWFFLFFSSAIFANPQSLVNAFSQRHITIVNETDLTFDLQTRPFEGSDFTPFPFVLSSGATLQTNLNSFDSQLNANGLILFSLNSGYVFSLIMKDAIVSVHGCKSKNVFFHPEDYVCQLSDTEHGGKKLLIKRPSSNAWM